MSRKGSRLGRVNPAFAAAAASAAPSAGSAGEQARLAPAYVEARRSGVLNLSARGLEAVPRRVTRLLEEEGLEAGEKWWECVPLSRLDVSHNALEALPEDLAGLGDALQALAAAHNRLRAPLPAGLGALVGLRRLDLSHNALDALPDVFEPLAALRVLLLQDNALERLPASICALPALETLECGDNRLAALPGDLGRLAALRTLAAGGNRVRALPASLTACARLERLDVSRNALRELPSLEPLGALAVLDASGNQLAALPFLPTGGAMRELAVSDNRLASLDGLHAVRGLAVVVARANRIGSVPREIAQLPLRILDLANNALDDVPSELGTVRTLHKLVLDGNYLGKIRRGVTDGSITEIKRYLRERLNPGAGGAEVDLDDLDEEARVVELAVRDAESAGMRLRLVGLGLAELPPDSRAFEVPLVAVDASRNRLEALPDGFLMLGDTLRVLRLDANRLAGLGPPQVLLGLRRLTELRLRKNSLREVPPELARLPELRVVDLRNNRIEEFGEGLASLAQVHTLLLGFNALREVPASVRRLESLTELDVGDNRVAELPGEALRALPALRTLNLENNDLARLPLELAVMPELAALVVNGNPLRQMNSAVARGGCGAIKEWLRKKIPLDSPLLAAEACDDGAGGGVAAIDYAERDRLEAAIEAINDELHDFSLSQAQRFALKKRLAVEKSKLIREVRRIKGLEAEAAAAAK